MKIGIIGATGAVGRQMITELESSSMAAYFTEVQLFASPSSHGKTINFQNRELKVESWDLEKAKNCTYILMSAGGEFSKNNAEKIASQGSIVIDNSSAWRMDPRVPLVVPEVNPESLNKIPKGIIANPNCSTIQMLVALKPIRDVYGLKTVIVSTYQSVSGSGQKGISELENQVSHQNFTNSSAQLYDQPIMSNVITWIGKFEKGSSCEEEYKMELETKKILRDDSLIVISSTARVPVFHCHSESITLQLKSEAKFEDLENILEHAPGLKYCSYGELSQLPSPYNCTGSRKVFVSRLRLLPHADTSTWVHFWNIADNLKKGAATNAVQILEHMLSKKASV